MRHQSLLGQPKHKTADVSLLVVASDNDRAFHRMSPHCSTASERMKAAEMRILGSFKITGGVNRRRSEAKFGRHAWTRKRRRPYKALFWSDIDKAKMSNNQACHVPLGSRFGGPSLESTPFLSEI